jgi:hypothetical protein
LSPDGGSSHTDYDSEPGIQIEFNKQNNEKRIDGERGEKNE